MYDIDNYFLDNIIGPVTERLVNDNPRTFAFPSFHESVFEVGFKIQNEHVGKLSETD